METNTPLGALRIIASQNCASKESVKDTIATMRRIARDAIKAHSHNEDPHAQYLRNLEDIAQPFDLDEPEYEHIKEWTRELLVSGFLDDDQWAETLCLREILDGCDYEGWLAVVSFGDCQFYGKGFCPADAVYAAVVQTGIF